MAFPNFLLGRGLANADMDDVPHGPTQRLNSCVGISSLLIRRLLNNCPSIRRQLSLENLIQRQILANMPAVLYQNALVLSATGKCVKAMNLLKRTMGKGHLPSRALVALMLIEGREGVAKDWRTAFKLVVDGSQRGCHHCQGMLAECYWNGYGVQSDIARSLEFAIISSNKGSRYGQFVLGELCRYGKGVAQDYAKAVELYLLAAAQNLDEAQWLLGYLNHDRKALHWFELAAAQGHPKGLYWVGYCYDNGKGGVSINNAEAIRWYKRSYDAGHYFTAAELRRVMRK